MSNLSSYVLERAQNDVEALKLQEKVTVGSCGCMGDCAYGPNMIIEDEDGKNRRKYNKVTPTEMGRIIRQEFVAQPSKKKRK